MLSIFFILSLYGTGANDVMNETDRDIQQLLIEQFERNKSVAEQKGCPFEPGTYYDAECV